MTRWTCAIAGCGRQFEAPEVLIRHQVSEHSACECKVCGARLPQGFVAIRHAFEEHTRAEYVRAYDATADDIRQREEVKEHVEERIDLATLLDELGVDRSTASVNE